MANKLITADIIPKIIKFKALNRIQLANPRLHVFLISSFNETDIVGFILLYHFRGFHKFSKSFTKIVKFSKLSIETDL